MLRPQDDGSLEATKIDEEADTFVHEIEIGDLDADGVLEVYATPSEPNRMDGSRQSGSVVRYVPAKGEGRVVVADLGDRHAKEILVDDVDGDGTDELYVSVEGHLEGEGGNKRLVDPVEIFPVPARARDAQATVNVLRRVTLAISSAWTGRCVRPIGPVQVAPGPVPGIVFRIAPVWATELATM